MADKETVTDGGEQEDRDFSAGFDDTPPAAPAADKQPEGKTGEDDTGVEPKAPASEPAPQAPTPPEYVQITKEQFETLQGAAAETATLKQRLDKAFGQMGGIQRIIQELQQATPKGDAIELPADVVSELETEFPELAGGVKAALTKAMKGLRGTGPGKAADVDMDAIKAVITDSLKTSAVERELEALEDAHPDWRKIVGADRKDEDPIDETLPYRVWLKSQPDDYQAKINNSRNALVISRSIDLFQKHQAAQAKPASQPTPKQPDPKAEARKNRVEASLQPRGDGGQPGPAKTPVDDFEAGFNDG